MIEMEQPPRPRKPNIDDRFRIAWRDDLIYRLGTFIFMLVSIILAIFIVMR